MAHKEYGVTDITDILRRARAGDSIRRSSKATGLDRKTISNYLRLAAGHGFSVDTADDQLDGIALAVFRTVHGIENKMPPPVVPPHRSSLTAIRSVTGWRRTV